MNEQVQQLALRIRNELMEVERVLRRIEEGWHRAQRSADDYYLDGVALNLHGFYGGLERVFERIAGVVDGERPAGENWHQVLLRRMAEDVPGVRPAVISQTTHEQLDEYRAFRHIARNIYTFNLDPAKVEHLVVQASVCFVHAQAELLAFADFLEQQASS